MLCPKVKVFFQRVLRGYTTMLSDNCLIIPSETIKLKHPSLSDVAIKDHKMILVATNGKYSFNGFLKIKPKTNVIVPICKAIAAVIQNGPKTDLLYACLTSWDPSRFARSSVCFTHIRIGE